MRHSGIYMGLLGPRHLEINKMLKTHTIFKKNHEEAYKLF